MASYIDRSLGEGETIIVRARFHWLYSFMAWCALLIPTLLLFGSLGWHFTDSDPDARNNATVLGIAVAGPLFLIGLWIFLSMMIRKWTTEIGVTSHRFAMKTGLLALHTSDLALPNIEGIKVEQSILGRIIGYGTVRIEGTGVDTVTTPAIADPVGFVRGIQTAKEHVAGLSTKI